MEQIMTNTFKNTSLLRVSRWSSVRQTLTEWQRRARSRRELMGLSDTGLRDIGCSRCDAEREGSKPFWMV
jgi:uncharacterized protein YjiS (DUF1127 family)